MSMVKRGVIQSHFKIIKEFIDKVIENDLKESATGLKYSVICLQFLLHSRTVDEWKSDATTMQIFERIVKFGLDSNEKV